MDKDIVAQFRDDMDSIISHWKNEEEILYNSIPNEIWLDEPGGAWNIYKPKMEEFPDFLWEIWFSNLETDSHYFTYGRIDREKIKQIIMGYVGEDSSSMDKGLFFEDLGTAIRDETKSLIRTIGKKFFDKKDTFPHTGQWLLREDYEVTKRYTLDFKFSDWEGQEQYRNIIKTAGKNEYSTISDLEDGIIRSLYSAGKDFNQMFKLENSVFTELEDDELKLITDTDAWKTGAGRYITDPRRKILIYFFKDGGVWASICLSYIKDWASAELSSGRFNELLDKHGAVPAKEFWRFMNYSTPTKDDNI